MASSPVTSPAFQETDLTLTYKIQHTKLAISGARTADCLLHHLLQL